MLTIQGNGGGRDTMDRAAMNMMGRLQGAGAPSQGEAPAATSVAQLLSQALKLTLRGGRAELAAWKLATDFLKANLGGGPEAESPMQPNPMEMAAQGVPQPGRPPR
jgi:hypothetical protein